MSGGFITGQGPGAHQVVIFTFSGQLSQENADRWNEVIRLLKQELGARLTGVTIRGETTPGG
jgi:hypothetical protein